MAMIPGTRLRHARLALLAIFLINGAVLASWIPRIPTIKADLGLTPSMLGMALLGPAVGALPAMRIAGTLAMHYGSAPLIRVLAPAYCIALIAPALAVDAWSLGACLVVLGATQGALIVVSNAHGVTIQRRYGRPIMAAFHAFYSMGGMLGSVAGGLAAQVGIRPIPQFACTGLVAVLATVLVTRWLLPRSEDARDPAYDEDGAVTKATPRFWMNSGTLVLGSLGFCVLLAEGAAADWSAVYLQENTHAGPGLAAAGYIAFAAAMTLGRLIGDRIVANFNPVSVVRASAALASLGLTTGLLAGNTVFGIVGFAALGAGLSGIVPILFSAAGKQRDIDSGPALAQVAGLSFLGFLAGPPLIGVIAASTNLTTGFAVPAALVGIVALGARAAGPAAHTCGTRKETETSTSSTQPSVQPATDATTDETIEG